jgi:hypothetical protein
MVRSLQGSRIVQNIAAHQVAAATGPSKAKWEITLSGNKLSAQRVGQSDESWRPSLFVEPDSMEATSAAPERPLRMLAALQDGGTARSGAKARREAPKNRWAWPAALTLVVVSAFLITLYVSGMAEMAGETPPDPSSRLPIVSVAPTSALPTAPPVVQPAAQPLPAAPASSPELSATATAPTALPPSAEPALPQVTANPEPTGPAKLEMRNDGLAALPGMATAVQAVSAQRAASAADAANATGSTVVATAAASAPATSRDQTRATPAKTSTAKSTAPKSRETSASGPRPAAKPKVQTATRNAPANHAVTNDPDAELVAAIMARSSGDRVSAANGERSSTIAALVRDCNALPDSGSALACRRRICEGYWGKAQACPRSMAPQAAAAAANPTSTGTAN